MTRSERAAWAEDTLRILQARKYSDESGRSHDMSAAIDTCITGTRYFSIDDIAVLRETQRVAAFVPATTIIEVANETTLAGVRHLLDAGTPPVAVLNFASAKNPGGGFLGGSQAQEESLARSSALYASQQRAMIFYERHRASPSLLYSDAMIYSPQCPVFRDDAGRLLEAPQFASFITSAAPNAGAIADRAADNRPHEADAIVETFDRRAEGVLALAAAQGYRRLVLGAWGCGVFRNDPRMVADVFAQHLRSDAYAGRFDTVRFSVFDATPVPRIFQAFVHALSGS
jgi:uncharacterized protein (TIGR02452 family)